MSNISENKNWIPEIMYEDAEEGLSSKIPFIMVPKDEAMPKLLYIFESRETGEFELGPHGDELPIIEMELHQYADMAILKNRLPEYLYDTVRECLGLKPLREAAQGGKKITENIRKNIEERTSPT